MRVWGCSTLGLVALLVIPAHAADDPIPIRECLAVGRAGGGFRGGGRSLVQPDAIAAALVSGRFTPPRAGDPLPGASGDGPKWAPAKLNAEGWFQGTGFAGGYAWASVPSDRDRVMILEATGHASVEVNGTPHAGDVYGYGYVKVPVALRQGDNGFLFRGGRGRLKASLVPPRAVAMIETADATLPDLVVGEPLDAEGAVVVVNASESPLTGATLSATIEGGEAVTTPVPTLLPLSVRKVGFRLRAPGLAGDGAKKLSLALTLKGAEKPADDAKAELRLRKPGEAIKKTFRSSIDGSVQYYGWVPAAKSGESRPGLILTLHGASVEGIGQAQVYAPRPWAHVVAPTNRRPYGFDWEDWGRADAIEVLDLTTKELVPDPKAIYLTGHSMGGHGTWHVGVTFPDRFAAIAPSAGWVSMTSYAGARAPEAKTPLAELLRRAALPSDTLALSPNLASLGVYVLHGSADDNVPVGQARQMRKQLGEFHPDFVYYERPGAGHWWGNECCDWPPLMDFLRQHQRPALAEVARVDFVTASPGVSSRAHWAEVEAQVEPFRLSTLHLRQDVKARRFSGTTENVARLALELTQLQGEGPVDVELDGQSLKGLTPSEGASRLWLTRQDGRWSAIGQPSPSLKNPRRNGPFKEAFRNRFLFVYGTKGTPEENAWALAKARADAERFWYQGNGSVEIVADTDFNPKAEPDRSVIVYGHAQSHAAWGALLGASPVQVTRGAIKVGGKTREGEDLACLFVRPRPGSDVASVGVISGTGLAGLKLTQSFPHFTSGVAYPDVFIAGTDVLTKGADAVVGAGFFGNDWSVESGTFVWKE